MAVPNRPLSQNKYSEQNMGNTSFDEDFGVNAVELIGYDSDNNLLRRVKVNSTGQIDTTATLVGGTAGVQYTEGDIDASITGTAAMMEVAANTLQPLQGTVADGLLVNLGGNNDVTVTGTVAATQSGTWDEVGINDSGNSITVDSPVGTPTFVRLSDGAAAITTLPVSLASVPSHAVTNAGTFAVQAAQSGTWTVQPGNTANTTAWKVDGSAVTQPVSGTFWQATQPVSGTVTANMGTVTADPFGANADAASATGSISAKLRFIASTGIPITGTVTVGSHAVTNAGTFAVQSTEVAPTTVYNGKKTVTTAGTRVTLASSTTVKSVTIKALAANTGTIYVGDTTVASTNGFALAAGDTVSIDIANLATVNIDSSVNGEGVTYIAIN